MTTNAFSAWPDHVGVSGLAAGRRLGVSTFSPRAGRPIDDIAEEIAKSPHARDVDAADI